MTTEQKRRRLLAVVALLASGGALAFLAFSGIGENLVYYWNPTELHAAGDKAVGASIRLGGLVAPGSIQYGDGLTLSFVVTDGEQQVPVVANAVPPAMFRESIGVVVEGTMGEDGVFHTQRLMVKHDNEYRPPGEADTRDTKELMQSLEPEGKYGT
ncbi:MAG TPA: cytochrome c maturation protein CcmE [Thermoanaerobaculia bacterium]|jgi:cytochrome c-type biogenesis protein CcmE